MKLNEAKIFDYFFCQNILQKKTKENLKLIEEHTPNKGSILDLGCGTGRLLIALSNKDYEIIGIDKWSDALDILKQKDKTKKIKVLNIDIIAVKKFVKKFNTIICFWNSFSEITISNKNEINVINLIYSALKKNGKFIIHQLYPNNLKTGKKLNFLKIINNNSFRMKLDVIKYSQRTGIMNAKQQISYNKNDKKINTEWQNINERYFHQKELEDIMKKIGFKIIKSTKQIRNVFHKEMIETIIIGQK